MRTGRLNRRNIFFFLFLPLLWTIWDWVYWSFTSHATIFQLYMWRHRCAGGLKKKLYLRSGSQHHRHFVGFFNMPVLHRHGTTLFTRLFQETAPFSRLLRHAGDNNTQYNFWTVRDFICGTHTLLTMHFEWRQGCWPNIVLKFRWRIGFGSHWISTRGV